MLLLLGSLASMSKNTKRVISLTVSIMPVLLLLMRSITQLTIKDVLLCLFITIIMVWYSAKVNS